MLESVAEENAQKVIKESFKLISLDDRHRYSATVQTNEECGQEQTGYLLRVVQFIRRDSQAVGNAETISYRE